MNIQERESRFAAGFDDGRSDRARRTGRSIGDDDRDYAFGYVAGKYKQINRKRIAGYIEAKEIWKTLLG